MNQHAGSTDQKWKKEVYKDILIWIILLLLQGASWGASQAPWGEWSTLVNFGVPSISTFLTAYFYMHLKEEKGMTRIFAIGGAAWLVILFSLILSDYRTRSWLNYPSRWPVFVRLRP